MKRLPVLFLFLFLSITSGVLAQHIKIHWEPREDLNILLPNSVRIFEANGILSDGEPFRAMYAMVDLNDENLKLRAVGSNRFRETTKEASARNNAILAINGGYFSNSASVSLLISDGELIAPGPSGKIARGAFGLVGGTPEIVWSKTPESSFFPLKYLQTTNFSSENMPAWNPNQAIGGGPILVKNGEIKVTGKEEGFGDGHLLRHPRTAIGYLNEKILILMIVDGRQETSAGVSWPELAELMKGLGVMDALNLDGGGSSAMVAANEVVNIPSDIPGGNRNSLRKNASALIFSEIEASKTPEIHLFDTEDENYSESGIWKSSNQLNYYGTSPSRISSAEYLQNKAVYHFNDLRRNQYQLGGWWTANKEINSEKVMYVVHQKNNSDTIFYDQTDLSKSGKWNILGNFNLGPGDSLEISATGEPGKFTADAIRLVAKKGSPQLPVRGDLRIAVISDLNSGLGATNYEWQVDSIIQRIPRLWKPDLVISGGDMVAGMGISDTLKLQEMWDGFDTHIAKPLQKANIPFAFTLGNHDGPRSHSIERDFTGEYWNKPENKPGLDFVDGSHFPNYYSFVKDDIFFVSWEASSSEITAENLEWMKQQFTTAEAKNAKLRFVMGHMPLYSSAQERDSKGNVLENPEKLRQLLQDYNVHTYISGHHHAYYPARRGELELLNTGAAGSGERGWLTLDKKPVNTITIMDVFYQRDTIVYSTYKIKEPNAEDMKLFDEKALPSGMFGVNGHMLRRDILSTETGSGKLSGFNITGISSEKGSGNVSATIENDRLVVSGNYSDLQGNLAKNNPVGLYLGRNTEFGEFIANLKVSSGKNSGSFRGKIDLTEDLRDYLSIGALFVQLKTTKKPDGALRTQIYPESNQAPSLSEILSHNSRNVYGIRDLEALYEVEWESSRDNDGDFISYIYQLAKDEEFNRLIFQQKTGRNTHLKMTEREWFQFLKNEAEGKPVNFYHRVIATDGSNLTINPPALLQLTKSNESLDDFIETPAPEYVFIGKIEDADGAGYGAQWDKDGKLWLANYNRGLIIKDKMGNNAGFSPITQVEIKGEIYSLKPVNGIGVDFDGNILVGRNRHLIKIDSQTGKGMAVWEVPEGNRAITAPRASKTGEIFAMSLFAEDGNYVLKQSTKEPSTFELIRTLELKDRNLSRTFDMTADGKTLYFPDPGSPVIQVYTSEDGVTYKKEKDISSAIAGSSAIQVLGKSLFVATRSSGISPSTFHFRDEEQQRMWTLSLPETNGAEPRGIGVSPDGKTLIFCSWDKGGGYFKYELRE